MPSLAERRIAQLSELRQQHMLRALAFEARGLSLSARQQFNAALVVHQRLERLAAAMNRKEKILTATTP